MSRIPEDYLLSSYGFDLPEERIAQQPAPARDGSRLLVLDRTKPQDAHCREAMFSDLPSVLAKKFPGGALMVANNSKVLPARIFGIRPTGGKVEFLLLTPLPLMQPDVVGNEARVRAEGLLRASKSMKSGQTVEFSPGFYLQVEQVGEFGKCEVRLHWPMNETDSDALGALAGLCVAQGHLPLPPYIRRPDTDADKERYQTTYADSSRTGSVAAPTAGLHFTSAIRDQLAASGFVWSEVTLYVGYGTFSPVRCQDIREHDMHREFVEVPEATAAAVRAAHAEKKPIIAIGTTSVRALEGAALAQNTTAQDLAAFRDWTDIFLYPGKEFRVTNHMLTNFHLPESSLVMMLSAFAGRTRVLRAYEQAIGSEYRFFSYGDSMLVL